MTDAPLALCRTKVIPIGSASQGLSVEFTSPQEPSKRTLYI